MALAAYPLIQRFLPSAKIIEIEAQLGDALSRLTNGAVWTLIGTAAMQGCTLAGSVLTARILDVHNFGRYGIIHSTIAVAGSLIATSIGLTVTKHLAELRLVDSQGASRIVGLSQTTALFVSTVMALFLYGVAPAISSHVFGDNTLSPPLRMGAVLLFAIGFTGAPLGILAGLERFKLIAWVNTIRGIATLVLLPLGARLLGFSGAVMGATLAGLLGIVVTLAVLRHELRNADLRPSYRITGAEINILMHFSLPALLTGAMAGPITWVSHTILVQQDGGYQEMGLYSAANHWRALLAFIPGLLAQPLLPVLSSICAKRDLRRFKYVLCTHTVAVMLATLIATLPILGLSHQIMTLYGADFSRGDASLRLLASATLLSVVPGVLGQAIASVGKMWWTFVLNGLWGISLLASTYLIVDRWGGGATGLAAAMLVSYFVHAATSAGCLVPLLRTLRVDSSQP